jgi:condensin complex subunit 2
MSSKGSKRKRLSAVGFTKNPDGSKNAAEFLDENDDEAEKLQVKKAKEAGEFKTPAKKAKRVSMAPERMEMDKSDEDVTSSQRSQAPQPTQPLSNQQLSDLYAQCLRLCNENKVNQKNSWNLKLIEYIDDVLDRQEKDTAEVLGTNFQVASCTLDASVKIYSYRVDSVHSEAYKMLGGLARTEGGEEEEENAAKAGDEGGDEEDKAFEGEKKDEKETAKRIKAYRGVNTLETNINNLNAKKIDLEFSVDPLFRKTSAAFDEGGAKGLLLNHLNVHNGCTIVFDSSDAVDEESSITRSSDSKVDLSDLAVMFKNIAKTARKYKICPQYADFDFGGEVKDLQEVQIAAEEEILLNDNFKQDEPDELEIQAGDDGGEVEAGWGLPEVSDFDHNLEAQELKLAQVIENQIFPANNVDDVVYQLVDVEPDEYNYFDKNALSNLNWAGPNHWKFKTKKSQLPKNANAEEAAEAEDEMSKKEKKRRKADLIDFSAEFDFGDIFDHGTKNYSTIQLPKAADPAGLFLPEDYHYDFQNFRMLFNKPVSIAMRALRKVGNEIVAENGGGAGLEDSFMPMENRDEEQIGNDMGNPIGSEFMGLGADDDDIDMAPAQLLDTSQMVENTAGQSIAEPRKIEKISINYARTAKIVDVKALKRNMWRQLATDPTTNSSQSDKVPEAKPFQDVMSEMPKLVDKAALKEISVPYYFICLLHLANEKNLELTQTNLDELTIQQN